MKQESRPTSRRVISSPRRNEVVVKTLTKGIHLELDPEKIQDEGLSDCDGFILYSGLFRKDWAATAATVVAVDNGTQTAIGSVPVCSA